MDNCGRQPGPAHQATYTQRHLTLTEPEAQHLMDSVYADTQHLPLLFWACGLLLLLFTGYALHHVRSSWALPCVAVLGTTTIWYLGDIVYSGLGHITTLFPMHIINRALWQVMLFLLTYILLCKEVAGWFVRDHEDGISILEQSDIFAGKEAQQRLGTVLWFAAIGWTVIFLIAQIVNGFPLKATLFPYLAGRSVGLWARERLGGATGFLISTGSFIHIFFSSLLGIILVLTRRMRTRVFAGIMVMLAWP